MWCLLPFNEICSEHFWSRAKRRIKLWSPLELTVLVEPRIGARWCCTYLLTAEDISVCFHVCLTMWAEMPPWHCQGFCAASLVMMQVLMMLLQVCSDAGALGVSCFLPAIAVLACLGCKLAAKHKCCALCSKISRRKASAMCICWNVSLHSVNPLKAPVKPCFTEPGQTD